MKKIDRIFRRYGLDDKFVSYEIDNGEVVSLEFSNTEDERFPKEVQLTECIAQFKELKTLYFEDYYFNEVYNIKEFDRIRELNKLEVISIRASTDLQNLDFIENMPNLNYLSLQGSNIKDISPLISKRKLEKITLSNANIKDISIVKEFPNLKEINFSGNKIRNIEALKNCRNLKVVELDNNRLTNIQVFYELKKLERFRLNDNLIEDITPIKQFNHIEGLDLSNNRIKDIDILSSLKSLKFLYLVNNEVESIESLAKLELLNYLDISQNPINSIYSIKKLHRLNYFIASDLENLKIERDFRLPRSLMLVHLNNCNLRDTSFLSNNNSIQRLNLSDNQYTNFTIHSLKSLRHLNLRNNKIKTTFSITPFPKINAIDLRGNYFGNKVFERYKGVAINYPYDFYKFNERERNEEELFADLKLLTLKQDNEKI